VWLDVSGRQLLASSYQLLAGLCPGQAFAIPAKRLQGEEKSNGGKAFITEEGANTMELAARS